MSAAEKVPLGLWEWLEELAAGECCCDEIDPKDKPCLTCEVQDAIRQVAGRWWQTTKCQSNAKDKPAREVLP